MKKRFLLYAAERPVIFGGYPDARDREMIPLFAIEAADRGDATRAARRHLLVRRRWVSFSDPVDFTHQTIEIFPGGFDETGRRLDQLELERARDLRIVTERAATRR